MLLPALLELGLRLRGLAGVHELADLVDAAALLLRLGGALMHVLIEHVLGHAAAVLVELGVRAVERAHLALDLVEHARVLGARVVGEQLLQPLLVRRDLVGDIEQAFEPLAIEPVGEGDRIVLELGDHARIEGRERGP